MLNRLFIVQAYHSKLKINDYAGLTLDKETGEKTIKTKEDRDIVNQNFPKHVKEIFGMLETFRE